MTERKEPPNFRDNTENCKCCASCKHIDWGYEGEADCDKYKKGVWYLHICDDYEPEVKR